MLPQQSRAGHVEAFLRCGQQCSLCCLLCNNLLLVIVTDSAVCSVCNIATLSFAWSHPANTPHVKTYLFLTAELKRLGNFPLKFDVPVGEGISAEQLHLNVSG